MPVALASRAFSLSLAFLPCPHSPCSTLTATQPLNLEPHTERRFLTEMGKFNYVTPTSYLELISTFKNLLNVKKDEVCRERVLS